MIGRKRHQHKLRAVRQFNIGGIMPGGAGPPRLRPQARAFDSLQRDPGKAMRLIIEVFARTGIVAFQ